MDSKVDFLPSGDVLAGTGIGWLLATVGELFLLLSGVTGCPLASELLLLPAVSRPGRSFAGPAEECSELLSRRALSTGTATYMGVSSLTKLLCLCRKVSITAPQGKGTKLYMS